MGSVRTFIAIPIIATMLLVINAPWGSVMADAVDVERVRTHVHTLAGEIGERNLFHPQALERAADYVEQVWRAQGFAVASHEYAVEGKTVVNLEVTREGTEPSAGILIVGAHYDSVFGSPGANDNGSGVAAMLEIAHHIAHLQPARTIRFVAFVNEEPPFFKTPSMGSRVYTKMALSRGDKIHAMLCLETIGYYSDAPGSQHYPPLFNFFYPDAGNFVGAVSNFGSRSLLKQVVTAFRSASDFPLEYISTFSFIPGVDWSDHWSFWREGIPAVMITDTALYRYPHYHMPTDTPDKVDYTRLARVIEALLAVIRTLANPANG
ncbi:MAG: M20/M25/M40 family metallo-hydrolase [Acidiferrobacterales bacterium]